MLKIVSFTRLFNDDDCLEAFVRHHAAHVDEMLFVDYGSTDRTTEILQALRHEGFPLRVFQSSAVSFDEIAVNGWGYQLASQVMAADFVLFLGADEFISTPEFQPLATLLPDDKPALQIEVQLYGMVGEEDETEIVVPWRLRWRRATGLHRHNLILRAKLPDLLIAPNAQTVLRNGQPLSAFPLETVKLAHYNYRNGWQAMQKYSLGHLNALAAGALGAKLSSAYHAPFTHLRDNPAAHLLDNPALYQEFLRSEAIEDPLPYLGGELSYSHPGDPGLKALSCLLYYAESLARQHGRLLDELPPAHRLVDDWNKSLKPLL